MGPLETQASPSKHWPDGQLHTVILALETRGQLHAPSTHVLGKSVLEAQHIAVSTVPPVFVHLSSIFVGGFDGMLDAELEGCEEGLF